MSRPHQEILWCSRKVYSSHVRPILFVLPPTRHRQQQQIRDRVLISVQETRQDAPIVFTFCEEKAAKSSFKVKKYVSNRGAKAACSDCSMPAGSEFREKRSSRKCANYSTRHTTIDLKATQCPPSQPTSATASASALTSAATLTATADKAVEPSVARIITEEAADTAQISHVPNLAMDNIDEIDSGTLFNC